MTKINWQDIAKTILKNYKNLHVKQIADIALKNNPQLNNMDIESISKKLSASLSKHVKLSKNKRLFEKVKKGTYRLKRTRTKSPSQTIEKIGKEYTGKAGEFALISELIFRGYDASIMSVDKGIDVIASKNNLVYLIQVKTSIRYDPKDSFSFTIKRSSFEKNHQCKTFYIFIMRYENQNKYIILHSDNLKKSIHNGVIKEAESLSLRVSHKNGKYFLNSKEVLNYHLDNFNLIK